MAKRRRRNAIAYALYLNAAVVCAMGLLFWMKDSTPAYAQMQPAIAGGAGVFVMPAQLSKDAFGCYLLDVDAQTLAVYQFLPAEKQLRLAAARTFKYDRKLGDFNTSLPSPMEVKELLEKQAHNVRGIEAPSTQAIQLPTGQ